MCLEGGVQIVGSTIERVALLRSIGDALWVKTVDFVYVCRHNKSIKGGSISGTPEGADTDIS